MYVCVCVFINLMSMGWGDDKVMCVNHVYVYYSKILCIYNDVILSLSLSLPPSFLSVLYYP